MLAFQTVLDDCGIVLVNLATESRDGNLHVFAAQRISNLTFQMV
jgi:hypothetical protein